MWLLSAEISKRRWPRQSGDQRRRKICRDNDEEFCYSNVWEICYGNVEEICYDDDEEIYCDDKAAFNDKNDDAVADAIDAEWVESDDDGNGWDERSFVDWWAPARGCRRWASWRGWGRLKGRGRSVFCQYRKPESWADWNSSLCVVEAWDRMLFCWAPNGRKE